MKKKVLAIILGGGKGTRLFPLTEQRSKPAVTFGGKYRLVDIPISNCINSGLRNIYVLTQFNSASLHMHINATYQFDSFSGGFVEILAAEQTPKHEGWYSGTADAVRKNFAHFHPQDPSRYLILSGDQLYRMDFQDFLNRHDEAEAEVSIAGTPVSRETAADLGIIQIDNTGAVLGFMEKPGKVKDISHMKMPASYMKKRGITEDKPFLASMGIYMFNRGVLESCLNNDKTDFGKEIIPAAIDQLRVSAYVYSGYWEDIGTIKAFYEANLNLAASLPIFNMYDANAPLYTRKLDLPPSKLNSCNLSRSLAAEGSVITEAFIKNSIVGVRSLIEAGASLDGVVCMGADYYEDEEQRVFNAAHKVPNIGIGAGSIIRKAIIDKNARIGKNCRIGIDKLEREDGDYGSYMILDGIIVLRKNAVLPDGSRI